MLSKSLTVLIKVERRSTVKEELEAARTMPAHGEADSNASTAKHANVDNSELYGAVDGEAQMYSAPQGGELYDGPSVEAQLYSAPEGGELYDGPGTPLTEPVVVTLDRSGGKSLGMSIGNAVSSLSGIAILFVTPGGQAEATGRISKKATIVSINGSSTIGFTQRDAAALIMKQTSIRLGLANALPGKSAGPDELYGVQKTGADVDFDAERRDAAMARRTASVFSPPAPPAGAEPDEMYDMPTVAAKDAPVQEMYGANDAPIQALGVSVTLSRANGKSLGISISSATSPTSGVAILKVNPGGQAEATGKFHLNVTIVAINGTSVIGFTQQQAVSEMIKSDSVVLELSQADAGHPTYPLRTSTHANDPSDEVDGELYGPPVVSKVSPAAEETEFDGFGDGGELYGPPVIAASSAAAEETQFDNGFEGGELYGTSDVVLHSSAAAEETQFDGFGDASVKLMQPPKGVSISPSKGLSKEEEQRQRLADFLGGKGGAGKVSTIKGRSKTSENATQIANAGPLNPRKETFDGFAAVDGEAAETYGAAAGGAANESFGGFDDVNGDEDELYGEMDVAPVTNDLAGGSNVKDIQASIAIANETFGGFDDVNGDEDELYGEMDVAPVGKESFDGFNEGGQGGELYGASAVVPHPKETFDGFGAAREPGGELYGPAVIQDADVYEPPAQSSARPRAASISATNEATVATRSTNVETPNNIIEIYGNFRMKYIGNIAVKSDNGDEVVADAYAQLTNPANNLDVHNDQCTIRVSGRTVRVFDPIDGSLINSTYIRIITFMAVVGDDTIKTVGYISKNHALGQLRCWLFASATEAAVELQQAFTKAFSNAHTLPNPFFSPPDQELINPPGSLVGQEIRRQFLTSTGVVGSGQFGEVHLAMMDEGGRGGKLGTNTVVAVKLLKMTALAEDRDEFVRECEAMLTLKDGENLCQLHGVSVRRRPWLCVIEFLKYGDVQALMQACQQKKFTVRLPEMLYMGWQIANGMAHMATKGLIHMDLAARNVLVDSGLVVKVCDFGLTRRVDVQSGVYKHTKAMKLPVKWMAIESIAKLAFSEKTDVWSFGVTLWEYGFR
jgi:hypothetical protein